MRPIAKVALSTLPLAGMLIAGCPKPPAPRYVPPPQRAAPERTSAQRIGLADRIVAEQPEDLDALTKAQRSLEQARQLKHRPFELHWKLARVFFLLARRLENNTQRVEAASKGVRHARAAVSADEGKVEGHYYLALNLAQIAEAESRLSLVKPMVAVAERAAAIDPSYDLAGPLVFLGKVYLTAPAWPVSIGSVEKAIPLLERALELAPRPLTRLFLGQAYYEGDREDEARRQLEQALGDDGPDRLEPRWRAEAVKALSELTP